MCAARYRGAFVAGCVMIAAVGCGESGSNSAGNAGTTSDAAATTRSDGPVSDAITVAGCLQKGPGDDFILTRINQPNQSVGTGGSPAGGSTGSAAGTVEREQLRSAAGAYRVEPSQGVQLEGLVGKEIRVEGRIKENMDLPRANAGAEPAKVGAGDLYEISATAVTTLAEVCKSAESPAPATSGVTAPNPNR